MTNFGKIQSYDARTGSGIILPEQGDQRIPFDGRDAASDDPRPKIHQRYAYDTLLPAHGGEPRAVNLRLQQTHREQAASQAG